MEAREKGRPTVERERERAKGNTVVYGRVPMRTPRCHRLTRVYWLYRGIRSSPGGTRVEGGKRGGERERNRGKKGKERPSERMDNGQMSVHQALSISHATNWGANRFVRVRILLFVRPWKMSCPDARDGRGKIFHKHEYFATTVAASDERRFRA